MKPSTQEIKALQKKILSWYEKNKRDLPWRKTTEPYAILVSEIMLQQTQVDRVMPYYERFLKSFPTLKSLSSADKKVLLEHWSGLGYNSRALRLQQLAQILTGKGKSIPSDKERLLELPGIGPYTANAVLAFSFNKDAPVMDTNIRRVLIHELGLREDISLDALEKIALKCIPSRKSREWHNALMDYGALIATAQKTGITSLSKQSQFEGSTRWARGEIVRRLIKGNAVDLKRLKADLKEEYSFNRIEEIVRKMEREGVIQREKNTLKFS